MYPAPFEYLRPGTWAEAVELLTRFGDDAKVLAGGQSLIPMMSLRLVRPAYVIDVGDVDAAGIREADGRIEIGALTRHGDVESSPILARAYPMLCEAAGMIGNVRVRNRGTVGGSLAHGDPSAELPCVLLALGATIQTMGPSGGRRIPVASFFETYFTTALEPTEVIVAVELPAPSDRRGSAFVELTRRAGDFATVEVAAVLSLDLDGEVCRDIRLCAGAISERPVDLSEAARELIGQRIDADRLDAAASAAAGSAEPRGDERGSSAYRKEMVRVLSKRALRHAWERGRGGG